MESFLGRYRNLVILVGVLFLQALGLAVQVKSSDAGNTRLIRVWAVDAITPFERALVAVQDGSSNLWHNYFYLRGVRAENRQLKEQIDQMRLEQVRLSQDAEQARRLQALLAFKEQTVAKTVAAQVIGSSGSDLSRILYIDKGENDGLKADMAVVTADGVVGILEKSRLQGVLRGTPNGEVILERVMSDEQVTPGEKVLSSGGDQVFPKGMPVGTVTKVSPGHGLFLDIKVKPAADLSRLEEVLVITDKQEREPVAETAGRTRAADILAERLPSVPDKPAADPATSKPATNQTATNQTTTNQTTTNQTATPASASGKTKSAASSGSSGTNGNAVPSKPVAKTNPSGSNAASSQPSPGKPPASTTQTETPSQDGPH